MPIPFIYLAETTCNFYGLDSTCDSGIVVEGPVDGNPFNFYTVWSYYAMILGFLMAVVLYYIQNTKNYNNFFKILFPAGSKQVIVSSVIFSLLTLTLYLHIKSLEYCLNFCLFPTVLLKVLGT